MKRPLVLLGAGFAAASAVLMFSPFFYWWLVGIAVVLAAVCLACPVSAAAKGRMAVLCAALLLACAASAGFSARAEVFRPLAGTTAPVRMTVVDWAERPSGSTVTLYGEVLVGQTRERMKVKAYSHGAADWQVGQKVEGTLRFTLPEEPSFRRSLYGSGCYLNAWVQELVPLPDETPLPTGPLVWGARVNDRLENGLLRIMPDENGRLLASVLLGGRTQLPEGVERDMRRSGVAHILVVSGLHLSVLCGIAAALLAKTGLSPRLRALAGMLVCFAVMAVAGFTPSVTRGGVMAMFVFLAGLARRRSDPFSALALAVLVLGVPNPWVLLSWSFLLSAGSVCSILLFAPPLRRWLVGLRKERFPKVQWADRVLEVLAVCLGAAVYAYPMQALMFGGLPLYGLAANLLISPATGLLLLCGAAVAVLGALGLWGIAGIVAVPAGWCALLCRGTAAFFASLPGAWQPLEHLWQEVWLVGAAAVLTFGALFLRRRPGRVPLLASAVVFTLTLGLASGALMDRNTVTLRTFEDSESLLILSGNQAVLVDADKQGAAYADALAGHQVLYTFSGTDRQAAALILQQYAPDAALLPQAMAEEIHPYLPEETALLQPTHRVALEQDIRLTAQPGCTLIEWKGLRVLKLLPGYAIIEESTQAPADLLVDAGGMMHTPQGQTRTFRLLPR